MTTSFIPESAPFNKEQRAWLNGFFSGMMGLQPGGDVAQLTAAAGLTSDTLPLPEAEPEEDFPWHDDSLPIVDRMELADGKPMERRLMAAMAQLDCGSCGYLCQTYGEAIASGEETNLTLCSPGGKETSKMIKKILKESAAATANNNGAAGNGAAGHGAASNGANGVYSRKQPYAAKLVESRPLNREGSAKDTRHVVIDLGDSGITYDVGDALGVFPVNCGELVDAILGKIGADANLAINVAGSDPKTLRTVLCEDYCLKDPSDELLELAISRVQDSDAKSTLQLMLDEGAPDGFDVLDTLDLMSDVPISATEFLDTLAPLNPRLYSIASSQACVGNQVHLTVGKVSYQRDGRMRKGTASTMLSDRLSPGDVLRVFPQANHGGFTVPSDPALPMIMVGPGTGIAPFMAFLQQRDASKAAGKNWLFFGDQHAATDFLYQDELNQYVESGLLTRLDTAFSRDGDQKVYVQDRMRENAAELWRWIEQGAHFYVCGDASRMAVDVDRALKSIVAEQGKMSDQAAADWVTQLAKEQRYVRDVY